MARLPDIGVRTCMKSPARDVIYRVSGKASFHSCVFVRSGQKGDDCPMFEPKLPVPPPNRLVHETDWPTAATIILLATVAMVSLIAVAFSAT